LAQKTAFLTVLGWFWPPKPVFYPYKYILP
jgi:hypothetical protein